MDEEEIFIVEYIKEREYMYNLKNIFNNPERRATTYESLASEINTKFNKIFTGKFMPSYIFLHYEEMYIMVEYQL